MRTVRALIVAFIASTMAAAAQAPAVPPMVQAHADAPVLASHPVLLASLRRITAGSALWREDLDALRGTGRRVFVVTPEHVVMADTPDGQRAGAFDPAVLAEVAPMPVDGSRVDTVLVVVNLPLIERVHAWRGSPAREVNADIDRILVHEVYGHALPYLLAGDLSGRCADPAPRQRADDACAIRRENAVRQELGLGRRTDYTLNGLSLASTLR